MATVAMQSESSHGPSGRPRASSYDVVVIGAGMGGLTAGALLARAGKSVLVVEAEQRPGGNARALRDGPYTFDLADHLIMGCEPDGPFGAGVTDAVLRHLGVRDRCDFVRVDAPVFEARFPGFRLGYPGGHEPYLRALVHEFPEEAEGLRRLVDVGGSVYREWLRFPMEPRMRDLVTLPWRFPTMFRYRNATLAEAIDRELRDPRAKAAYAGLSLWMILPPVRATFAMWSFMMGAYIEQGAYYCRGSFQVLADAVAEALKRDGGELLLGTRVTRILAPDRRVEAVELKGGERITARQVISGIDARETFGRLLQPARLPRRYVRRLKRAAPSEDVAILYLATDLDVRALGVPFQTCVYTGWDIDESYARATTTREVTYLDVMIPTLIDPALAPPGEHIVMLGTYPLPKDAAADAAADEQRAEEMLELAEHVLPGLRDHITHVGSDKVGPGQRYPLRRANAVYGWEVSPHHVGLKRLPQRTPIDGLLLVGHWTRPGPGVITVIASAIQAARLALGEPATRPVLPVELPVALRPAAAKR